MQSDVAEYEYFRTQHDRGSLLFAFLEHIDKTISIPISINCLSIIGAIWVFFNSYKLQGKKLFWLSIIYSVVPIVLKVIAIFIMCKFPLTSKKQSIIKNRLIKLEQTRGKNMLSKIIGRTFWGYLLLFFIGGCGSMKPSDFST